MTTPPDPAPRAMEPFTPPDDPLTPSGETIADQLMAMAHGGAKFTAYNSSGRAAIEAINDALSAAEARGREAERREIVNELLPILDGCIGWIGRGCAYETDEIRVASLAKRIADAFEKYRALLAPDSLQHKEEPQ